MSNSRFLFKLYLLLAGWMGLTCSATTYHVKVNGDDSAAGTTPETAFRTVQRGVNALATGDTLVVGPGEYRENVYRSGLGNLEHETVIRAEIPGTAVLRGDIPAPEFQPSPGYRFVWEAPFDRPVQAVNLLDSLTILETMPSIAELEFTPGSCHYDPDAKKLYIATPDLKPPGKRRFTVSVLAGHGLRLESATRVTVKGLAASGFNYPTSLEYRQIWCAWGILISRGRQCRVVNSTAFMNGGGIGLHSRDWGSNVVERCLAYGNFSRHAQLAGNLFGIAPNNDEIRDSIAWRSPSNGIRFHSGGRGRGIIRNCLAWGNAQSDIWIKCSDKRAPDDDFEGSNQGFAANNVALGQCSVVNLRDSLFGGGNAYRGGSDPIARDTLHYSGSIRKNSNKIFADPLNYDFRLQKSAPLRGKGPDGRDPGPYPYLPNIRYVSNDGSDESDGLDLSSAWRTITHAFSKLQPGDTLYIEPGVYEESPALKIGGSSAAPVSIRGRGRAPAIIRGDLVLRNVEAIEMTRLHLDGKLDIEFAADDSANFTIEQSYLNSADTCLTASGKGRLFVRNTLCSGFGVAGIKLQNGASTVVRDTIFDHTAGVAISSTSPADLLYSAGNALSQPQSFHETASRVFALAELQAEARDFGSLELRADLTTADGYTTIANFRDFAGKGSLATAIGPSWPEADPPQCELSGPQAHSVGATTANLEWWTSYPADVTLAWGETPDCSERVTFDANCYGNYSLTNLKPDTEYYARIEKIAPLAVLEARWSEREFDSAKTTFSFKTLPATPAPVEYYVATNGNDKADGLTLSTAFRTIQQAASKVAPGDTVWISAGTYPENIRIRTTGLPESPISFRSLPGERVVISGGNRAMPSAFLIDQKSDIKFDGFYFEQQSGSDVNAYHWHPWRSGVFRIVRSQRVSISRCFHDGRGAGTAPVFVHGWKTPELEVRNCVIMAGFDGMMISDCPDLVIENSVFIRNSIHAAYLSGGVGGRVTFRKNIVCDSIAEKQSVTLLSISDTHSFYHAAGEFKVENFVESDNGYCIRLADEERKLFNFGKEGRHSVADLQSLQTGASGSILGDPAFAIYNLPDTEQIPENRFAGDHIVSQKLDFQALFATNPKFVEKGIGLDPNAFKQ